MSSMQQQSPEWEEMRKTRIGASDAPVIMGVSPWTTPFQLWQEKISGKKKPAQKHMVKGIEMEDEARMAFFLQTGIKVSPIVVVHPEMDWMMASLDGMDDGRKVGVEIKNPGQKDHALAKLGKIPEFYYPQLQHQMEVCGLDKQLYFSYHDNEGILLEVERDDKFIKQMIKKEKEFLECMQEMTPPELTLKDYKSRKDDIWNHAAGEWLHTSKELKILEARERELREVLVSLCGSQSSRGAGVKVAKIIRKGAVDYSKIEILNTIDLDEYRKPSSEYWKVAEG